MRNDFSAESEDAKLGVNEPIKTLVVFKSSDFSCHKLVEKMSAKLCIEACTF